METNNNKYDCYQHKWPYKQWCIGGYTRVYGVYQPPGFFDSDTHLSDHK